MLCFVAIANETTHSLRDLLDHRTKEVEEKEVIIRKTQDSLKESDNKYTHINSALGSLQKEFDNKMEELHQLQGDFKDVFMRLGKQGEILLECQKQNQSLKQKNEILESEKEKNLPQRIVENKISEESYHILNKENEILQQKLQQLQNEISSNSEISSKECANITEIYTKNLKEMESVISQNNEMKAAYDADMNNLILLKTQITELEKKRKEDENGFFVMRERER